MYFVTEFVFYINFPILTIWNNIILSKPLSLTELKGKTTIIPEFSGYF